MGLIANNFVRVYHQVNRDSDGNCNGNYSTRPSEMGNVTIEAAILSLRHSFMVDNYDCGNDLGTLTVTGAIAQKYRGPVGTGSGGSVDTGYLKNYTYDDRLRYRSPPFFLQPGRRRLGGRPLQRAGAGPLTRRRRLTRAPRARRSGDRRRAA